MVNHQFIARLRKQKNFSQSFVASKIEVSRPTYIKIESGARELTITEAQKLAGIFEISLDALMRGDDAQYDVVIEPEKKGSPKTEQMRISIPQENAKKFKEVLLYILNKVGGKPNVGMTVLYKLLYFIDFDYYEKFEEQLIGAKYIRNHFGPSPVAFAKIIAGMENRKEVVAVQNKYFERDQKKFLPLCKPDLAVLNGQEIAHVDEVLARLSDKSATELSALSHKDVPWLVAKEGEVINYESVFYRSDETSVREYDENDPL